MALCSRSGLSACISNSCKNISNTKMVNTKKVTDTIKRKSDINFNLLLNHTHEGVHFSHNLTLLGVCRLFKIIECCIWHFKNACLLSDLLEGRNLLGNRWWDFLFTLRALREGQPKVRVAQTQGLVEGWERRLAGKDVQMFQTKISSQHITFTS